ncbi:hypothetical protein GBA52_012086 [Prunus armeniaca]|nr:hypothetical protein GBA52_012086 [Prunus armeniaca]
MKHKTVLRVAGYSTRLLIQADFHVLPLGVCSMVLGARWFRNLVSRLWDFSSFMMESSINGQRCIVYGKMKEPNG